jgi:hypothetical protein
MSPSLHSNKGNALDGDAYTPPGHVVITKYWKRRNSCEEYSRTEEPLTVNPYLWVSTEIDVRPGIVKLSSGKSEYLPSPPGNEHTKTHASEHAVSPGKMHRWHQKASQAAVHMHADPMTARHMHQLGPD